MACSSMQLTQVCIAATDREVVHPHVLPSALLCDSMPSKSIGGQQQVPDDAGILATSPDMGNKASDAKLVSLHGLSSYACAG